MLLAVAAAAFVSCQKAETAPQSELVTLTFSSSNPQTKTEWNGSTIVWSEKDKIRVACLLGQAWQNNNGDVTGTAKAKLYQSNGLPEDKQAEAKFTVPTNFNEDNFTGKTSQFYAIYPDTATDLDFMAPNAVVTIPSTQSVTGDTFDKTADLLWGKSVQVAGFPTEAVSMYWTRLVAHADITLKGLGTGEKVNSVVLTAQDGLALVGKFNVDITTGAVSSNAPQNTVTVNCTDLTVDETGEASFWACINPCTITSLDIVVDTDAATYTISKSGFEREFLVNKRNALTINMADAERVEKEGTSVTYTFTSKAWEDVTNSWVSGKDCTNMTSGRGVKIEAKDTGANATCQQNFSEISKIVVTYSTNASNGVGSIAFAIGTTVMSKDVTKNGGTVDRTLEYDFSSNPVSGQPTVTVTCTANAIYIKSIEIITMN